MSTKITQKHLYLCNGKVPKCTNSLGCYINGGHCCHTKDKTFYTNGGLSDEFEDR